MPSIAKHFPSDEFYHRTVVATAAYLILDGILLRPRPELLYRPELRLSPFQLQPLAVQLEPFAFDPQPLRILVAAAQFRRVSAQ